MRGLAVPIVAALATGSCSLLTTTGDLVGTKSNVGTQDAGDSDAGSVPEKDGASEASRTFCAGLSPTPDFCRDFDDGKPADYGFNDNNVTDSVTSLTLSNDASSLPNSLLASATSGSAGFISSRFSAKLAEVQGTTIRFSFDMKFDTGNAQVAFLVIAQAGKPDYVLQLWMSAGGMSLVDYVALGQPAAPFSPPPPFGKWTHVEVELDFGTKRVRGRVGGIVATDTAMSNAAHWGQLTLGIGSFWLSERPLTVRFDNIVADIQ